LINAHYIIALNTIAEVYAGARFGLTMTLSTALLFALGALLLNGLFELVYRLAHRGDMHENSYMVVQTGTVFVCLLVLSSSGIGFELTPTLFLLGIVAGINGWITGWTYLYAMGRGPVAVTSAVRKLGFVVTALLAVFFLDESLSSERIIALAVAALALVVMAWSPDADHRPHPVVFISLFTAGLMTFFHKLAAISGVSVTAFLMVQAGTAHLTSHIACLRGDGYRYRRQLSSYALLTGVVIALMMTFSMYALRNGDAVVIAPILQLGFLVTAPLSFWLFREQVTARKLLGLGVGAAAIVMFAQGQ